MISPTPAPDRRVHIVQGEFAISADPADMLTTILGSCVAACIRDPIARVGGMNHFLLPGEIGAEGVRYGVNAMELLVNGLLQRGARRERLSATIFGGANVVPGLSDIGAQNAEFAERFFKEEAITFAGGSTGGGRARRIQFWPYEGRTRQQYLERHESVGIERPFVRPTPQADTGSLELF
ncbi:MAG: chemotaxis protein CheD [Caulobacterales bacterium 32-69-10]|nr:MAG: chemotaxis protein CheD [Caulobacterales bacterium 32-69-10]